MASVLKAANDAQIEKKKLRMYAINLYNKCQYNCFAQKNPEQNEFCLQQCQQDHEGYLNYKRKNKNPDAVRFFYALAEGEAKDRNEYYEFQRKAIDMDVQQQNYLNNLKTYLKGLDDKYSQKKK